MLSIFNSEKFQTEYKNYKELIEQVTDLRLKSTLENHLSKLVAHVKHLDSHHEEMIFTKQIKEMSGDNRDKILEVRRFLNKSIKDYFRANNIKLTQNL
jgi:siroheme synthase (precorrin-2 oxidase/ferrochelatase)